MASLPFSSFLKVRSATGGAFSPDGRTLAFLMNTTGVAQVFRLDEPGGAPVQLTHLDQIVRSVHWSPDGRRLLFAMDHGGNEHTQLYLAAADGGGLAALTDAPGAIHTFGGWSPDSRRISFAANRRNPAHFDLYVLDVETGQEQCVLEREATLTPFGWSPDGASVLVRQDHRSDDQDLYLLELAGGSLRHLTPHSGYARYLSPRFLPDGRCVLLCTDQERDFTALASLDLETLTLGGIYEPEAEVEFCDAPASGDRIVYVVNREGYSEAACARLREGALCDSRTLASGAVVPELRLSADGSRAAMTLTTPTANLNVWGFDTLAGRGEQWTSAPMDELGAAALAVPELVRYRSQDGLQIPAWLYRPAGERVQGLPVVVHVHGGPESQDRPGFNAVYQYLVHRGYAVVAPNVRGSAGYGKAYLHMDDVEKRYDALRDVEYAHHWLTSSGIGDPARIAIMGASYGGFTVLYSLTRRPELWAAGVDIVGIANFETFFEHTGPWRRHLRASEYGDPERDRELLRDLSPIHRVDQIRAPLMIVQGANDPRVPQEESDQMVEQLRARNHPVEYLLFEDEGHGITKIPNRLKAYPAIAAFLDRYLAPGA